jgi:homoserine O-succinyltransferase
MVVNVDASRLSDDYAPVKARRATKRQRPKQASDCVTIGLLNNMAGAAFQATERQFVSLLNAASDGIPLHVSFYTLPGLSPTEAGGQHFARHYASVEKLHGTHLDGLIVTGREPKMADLRDEPYWQSFTEVLEWARTHTHSAVWSCLAAHAAVLHMDGIRRHKSEVKNFGVFECEQVAEHPLMKGVTQRFHVPHSRWNGVAQDDLLSHGYQVLSRIAGNGVDAFIKQEQSLFVFFQGHLEYETATLMREYRRDVIRFVRGESETYPQLPSGYFNAEAEKALTALRARAGSLRGTELSSAVAAATDGAEIVNAWQPSAGSIYRNWLQLICAAKQQAALGSLVDAEAV